MSELTAEELVKLCDAAEREIPKCSHPLEPYHCIPDHPEPGCASCDIHMAAWNATEKLDDLGFSDPARARSYATLQAENQGLKGLVERLSKREWGLPTYESCQCGSAPHEGPCDGRFCECKEYKPEDAEGHALKAEVDALLAKATS